MNWIGDAFKIEGDHPPLKFTRAESDVTSCGDAETTPPRIFTDRFDLLNQKERKKNQFGGGAVGVT